MGEPLLHFFAIGLVVFGVFSLRQPSVPDAPDAVIEVTPAQVERLVGQFEAVWRRSPTATERQALLDDYLKEEVYYREALALGLDGDDTVIRQRLRQKMEFIGDAAAGALAPDEAVLWEYFESHPERFAAPARVSFRQIFLGDADPEAALAAIADGAEPASVGRGSLLPPAMDMAVESTVDGVFGTGFFAVVEGLGPGEWRGPVSSAYGGHLVWLEESRRAAMPAFEAVRNQVEADWRREKAEELRAEQFQALRGRYRVVLPADSQ